MTKHHKRKKVHAKAALQHFQKAVSKIGKSQETNEVKTFDSKEKIDASKEQLSHGEVFITDGLIVHFQLRRNIF